MTHKILEAHRAVEDAMSSGVMDITNAIAFIDAEQDAWKLEKLSIQNEIALLENSLATN